MAAVPWALITLAPIHLPGWGRLRDLAHAWAADPGLEAGNTVSAAGRLLRQPITDQLIVQLLALAVWLIWAAFVLCLLAEAGSLASGIPAPHLPGLGGMQTAASWLLTGTLAGLLASSAVVTPSNTHSLSPADSTAASTTLASTTRASASASSTTLAAQTRGERLVYVVRPGDWLGAIAHRFLGDYDAYARLQRANPRLIPDTAGPHGPDHIEPGWHLLLPSGARDRGHQEHAAGRTFTRGQDSAGDPSSSSGPARPGEGTVPASTPGPAPDADTGTSVPETSAAPAATGAPSAQLAPASTAATSPIQQTPGAAAPSAGTLDQTPRPNHETHDDAGDHSQDPDDRDAGMHVGEGWISWPLAASLAAVAALVWLARRRRYLYTDPFSYPDDPADNHDEIGDPDDAQDQAQPEDPYAPGMMGAGEAARPEDLGDSGDADAGDAKATPLYWSIRHAPPTQASDDGRTEGTTRRGRRADTAKRLSPAEDDEDLRPMPVALNRIRLLVQAHGDALAGPQPTATVALASQVHPSLDGGSGHGGSQNEAAPDTRASAGADRPPALGHSSQGSAPATHGLPAVGPSGAQLVGLRDIPREGVGLTGPGARDAARALLLAALAAGGPADPDAAGTVVTTFDTLNALIGGSAAVNVDGIPRLQIAGDVDSALSILDEHILTRRRTLDEHDESDLLRLREEQPWSAPMPPVLLLTQAPPTSAGPIKARLSTSLHLGGDLQITGVLLGDWPRGQTFDVDASGHANIHSSAEDARPAQSLPRNGIRLAVMGIADTVDLLAALGEAQTGEPMTLSATPTAAERSRTAEAPDPEPPAEPVGPTRPADPNPSTQPTGLADGTVQTRLSGPADGLDLTGAKPADGPPSGQEPGWPDRHSVEFPSAGDSSARVSLPPRPAGSPGSTGEEWIRLQVLGAPMVFDRDGGPVPGLRSGAIQVLTILAVHRDGHPLKDIMEKMWPDAPVRRAADRLSTEAANLRRTVRIAMGRPDDRTQATNAVINTGSYYILNENLVEIDLWQLQDLVNTAKDTNDPDARMVLLRQAIAAHAGPLADGRDYPWADVARHQIQRHGIRARLHLAQLLAEHDLSEAAQVVAQAADADPVSEDLAQRAIRASAAAGDGGAVRARLRTLRAALEEIDQEPTGETLALVANIAIAKPSGRSVARLQDSQPGIAALAARVDDETPGFPTQEDRKDER